MVSRGQEQAPIGGVDRGGDHPVQRGQHREVWQAQDVRHDVLVGPGRPQLASCGPTHPANGAVEHAAQCVRPEDLQRGDLGVQAQTDEGLSSSIESRWIVGGQEGVQGLLGHPVDGGLGDDGRQLVHAPSRAAQ